MSTQTRPHETSIGLQRMSRRALLGLAVALSVASIEGTLGAETQGPTIRVYKSPTCQCCELWVQHLRRAGFAVTVENSGNLSSIKQELAVPAAVQSCHTAKIGRYFIEGHVPVQDIRRLLEQHPNARGLAVPGMPIGSPGMESPSGEHAPFQVLLVSTDGSTSVFSEHSSAPTR